MQDHDQDGKLSFSEFSELVDAFGNQVAASKVCAFFCFFRNFFAALSYNIHSFLV